MAKKIEELIVELGIKGLEGLDSLSSSFRNLQKAIGPSDQAISQVRKSILDMSSAGKQSIQMIQGQIDAFKGLQTQATIGSNVYKQLAGDVNRLSDTLKKLKGDYEEVGRAAKQTDAQIASQFPAARPNAFRTQLAALNRQLEQISVSTRAYGDLLTEITRRELAFGRAQARQQVIAGAQAVGDPLIARMTPRQDLPNTLAALQLRISELTQDFDNLDRAGEQYAPTLAEINRLQRELTKATEDGNADRKAEIKERIENYRAIQAENAAAREQAAIRRSMARGRARMAEGALQAPAAPTGRTSALFQSIANIGLGGVARDVELMGNSYANVEGVIRRVSAASDGSIASLQRQRGAWQQLFVQLVPGTATFKRVGNEIEQLDRRLERLQRTRRRMGAMEATQAAGAVISGGIFGGPEGALGGVIGTAVGGVPGAFAGAAIGAQVGMIRQQLGAMASFTAEIDKQRIALRNVVGSQRQYQEALQFIDATSRRAAIPQDQLTKRFTQLAASVIGAGGNVDVAKVAFEGIAAGIRGTGGSLQDLDAALLATAQVFSKGKVSAEELRQQIGERFPGAFSLFAEATGRTTQELDKALERGEVGLNDFVKFALESSRRYSASQNQIAASSQAAGDRIQVTFARLREAVGRELQPVGAQFQEIFARFFEDNEQAIVDFARSIADLTKLITNNADLIANALKVLIGLASAAAAAFVATKIAAGVAVITAKITLAATAVAQLGGIASVTSLAINTLSTSMFAVPGIGWTAAAIVGLGLLGKAVYDTNEIFRNWVNNIADVVARDFENSMDKIAKDAEDTSDRINTAFTNIEKNVSPVASFIQQIFEDVFGSVANSGESSAKRIGNGFANAFTAMQSSASAGFSGLTRLIANWWQNLPAPIRSILGGNTGSLLVGAAQYATSASQRAAAGRPVGTFGETAGYGRYGAPSQQVDFKYDPFSFEVDKPSGGGAGGGKAAKGPESRAAELQLELNLRRQMLEAESMIAQARLDGDERLAAMLSTLQAQTRLATEAAKIELEKIPAQDKALRLQLLEQDALQESAKSSFVLAELDKRAMEERVNKAKEFKQIIEDLKIKTGEISGEQFKQLEIDREIEAILTRFPDLTQAQIDKVKELVIASKEEPSAFQRLQEGVKAVKDELAKLTDPVNQIIGAANAIGDAFGNSFKGLITGATTAKEALASFFSSVADYFADMAAKMIAEWIKLVILNTIVRIFNPGAGAASDLSDLNAPATINNPLGVLKENANGNAFAANGIVPYAKGGIVNRPTMFKFARGGTMQTGIMGEAGPEAIMPLKRGPDGKLGVQAAGGGAVTVNVSVDAKGTQVQGDPGQGQQLGRVIAGAVQAELIKQQRPGGLLANPR